MVAGDEVAAGPAQHRDAEAADRVDEWNVFYRRNDFAKYGTLHEEQYDLADARCVASYLNTLIRNAHAVTMANMAQLVNVIAPIFASPEGLFLQTIFYPLLMHAEHRGAIALDAPCESETFAAHGETVNYVDTAVTFDDASGSVYVHAVNPPPRPGRDAQRRRSRRRTGYRRGGLGD